MKINKSKIIQAVLCCLLWSTAIPVLKIVYSELNMTSDDFYGRLVLAGIRFMLAGIILFIYSIITNKRVPIVRSELFTKVLVFALLNTTLQYLFFFTGVMNAGAINGVLIDSTKPFIIIVLAHFFSKDDKISFNKIVGLCLGILGIAIANITGIAGGGLSVAMKFNGEGMLVLSSLVNAIAVIYGKKIMEKIHYLPLNAYQMLIGSTILLVVGLIGDGGFLLEFTPLSVVLLIYSSVLSAVAFTIWYKLMAKYRASSISMFLFLIPVSGSIISSVVFPQESITINVLIGLVLLTIGIIYVNYEKAAESK